MNILFYPLLASAMLVAGFSYAQQSKTTPAVYSITKADSLFQLRQWKAATREYEGALQLEEHKKNAVAWNRLGFSQYNLGLYDKALENYQLAVKAGPAPQLKPVLFSRLARVYAIKKQNDQSIDWLRQAIDAGYLNLAELDTAAEYNAFRNTAPFRELMNRAEINAFPCRSDTLKRAFDFWVGEWDVFVTGTNNGAGHSLIQKASGDCMILENWTGFGPVPSNGKSMNYVNTQTKKWEQLWIGSGGGPNYVTRFWDGEYKDSVMQFIFEASTPQGKLNGRFRFFNQGPNQVRQLSETSADGGKTWQSNYDFTYKRKK
ncbi:MAG: tetratricopeptide repeat protein [Chitinophagaceae bacterium]